MTADALVIEAQGSALSGRRSKHWVKVKNRAHPAMSRVMEAFALRGDRTACVLRGGDVRPNWDEGKRSSGF